MLECIIISPLIVTPESVISVTLSVILFELNFKVMCDVYKNLYIMYKAVKKNSSAFFSIGTLKKTDFTLQYWHQECQIIR